MKTGLVDENSILIRHDVEPEEIAIWLEMNGLNDAKGIKSILREAEKLCIDWQKDISLLPVQSYVANGIASKNVFRNLFNVIFKCFSDKMSMDLAKSLVSFAYARVKKIREKAKEAKTKDIIRRRSLLDLLEVYCELKDRLEEVLGTAR